jgi:hypothetical protein
MSLSAWKDSANVAVEVRMHRTVFAGAFLLVEGFDDSRFFRSRVQDGTCEIVVAGGKPALFGGMDRLNNEGFAGALGVFDDDCDSLDGRYVVRPNLISTGDFRDLDAFLIWSPALGRLLDEFADVKKVKAFGGVEGVRSRLVELALPFGNLRRWSSAKQAGLSFKELPPSRFVKRDWSFDPQELFQAAAKLLGWQANELMKQVAELPPAGASAVCHGHDMIKILGIGLTGRVLGPRKRGEVPVGSVLRTSLDSSPWLASQLAQDILGWEGSHPPFRVLARSAGSAANHQNKSAKI